MMHDGRALQSGTSHFFGQKFSEAYDITFTDKDNQLKYVWQTSWGVTTRMIGAMIMVHGDNKGLCLPPHIAPTQVMIIPIQQKKDGVLDKAYELRDRLSSFKVKVDDSDKTPGYKYAEQEMRGIPLRLEVGPRDIENKVCVLVRRDTLEKIEVSMDEIETKVAELLDTMQKDMLEKARAHMAAETTEAKTAAEFKAHFEKGNGFVEAMWCGDRACEDKIKEELGVTSRCMPFEQKEISGTCVCCGKPAHKMVIWAKAY